MSLVTDAQELLDEVSGAIFWPAQTIYDALNDTLLDVYAEFKWTFISATLTLGAGDDLVTIPTTIFIPQYLLFNNKKYFITTHAKLEQYNREWRKFSNSQPIHFVLWDAERLRCFPKPNTTYAYSIVGVPWPSEITAANEDITAPRLVKKVIVKRAVAKLLWSTLPDQAEIIRASANDDKLEFKRQLRNRSGHRINRLRPETLFTKAQGGVVAIGKQFT